MLRPGLFPLLLMVGPDRTSQFPRVSESLVQLLNAADELSGLALRRSQDQHERRRLQERGSQCQCRRHEGFTDLSRTEEQELRFLTLQDLALPRVRGHSGLV